MHTKIILLIDNRSAYLRRYEECLKQGGYNCVLAERSNKAVQLFEERQFDAVLLNLNLPDNESTQLLSRLVRKAPSCPVLVIIPEDSSENIIDII